MIIYLKSAFVVTQTHTPAFPPQSKKKTKKRNVSLTFFKKEAFNQTRTKSTLIMPLESPLSCLLTNLGSRHKKKAQMTHVASTRFQYLEYGRRSYQKTESIIFWNFHIINHQRSISLRHNASGAFILV